MATLGGSLRSLTMLMDSYVNDSAVSTSITSSNDQLGDDLIRLAGAELVTTVEAKHGQCFAEAKIKTLLVVT